MFRRPRLSGPGVDFSRKVAAIIHCSPLGGCALRGTRRGTERGGRRAGDPASAALPRIGLGGACSNTTWAPCTASVSRAVQLNLRSCTPWHHGFFPFAVVFCNTTFSGSEAALARLVLGLSNGQLSRKLSRSGRSAARRVADQTDDRCQQGSCVIGRLARTIL